MPSRVIREGILTSERVNKIALDPKCEVFYRRLFNVVDDYGRHDGLPALLRAALYPLMIDAVSVQDICTYLDACETAGLIRRYEVSGKPYIELWNFHQRLRRMKSKYPPPSGKESTAVDGHLTAECGQMTAECGQVTASGRELPPPAADCCPESESETETDLETDTGARDSSDARQFNPWDQFREAYPECKRNVRVESSCRAYVSRISGKQGEHDRLMEGLRRHLACDQWERSLREDGGRFIPSMEKFIADGLYLDHPPVFREDAQRGQPALEQAPSVATGMKWDPATEQFVRGEPVQ